MDTSLTTCSLSNLLKSTQKNELSGVASIAKKALNKLSSQRLVPIQEAVHEIMLYDLVVTSETFTTASLAQCQKLQTQKEKEETQSQNIVSKYINRPDSLDHISLEQYFYQHFCVDSFDETKEGRILMAKGLNFKPKYPVDFNYARGIILLHKPWGPNNPPLKPIFQDKDLAILTFHRMIANKEVPTSVVTQYNLTIKYSQRARIELLAKQGTTDDNPNLNDMDENEQELYLASEHYGSMTDNKTQIRNRIGNKEVNIGIGHDWTTRTVNPYVDVDGRNYIGKLSDEFYKSMNEPVTSPDMLRLPKREDGKKYNFQECTSEQATIVLAAVDTVIKFITNDKEYRPLRATVVGEAGTGKSYVINTLTTIVRNLTQCNDTVIVAAPSGAAAYNVGGCTLHRSLMIAVDEKISKLSEDKKKVLQIQLKRVLVFIIDERSMVGSKLLANAESHLRQCAFNGNNISEYWGGVPVVIAFGDDYQLPPVIQEGAIMGFAKSSGNTTTDTSRMKKNDQLSATYGSQLFIENLTDSVFILSVNKRVKGDHDQYKNLLKRLRVGKPSNEDADKLCNLHLSEYPAEFESELESKGKVMYLCATHKVKNEINERKLAELSHKTNVPIAAFLDCHFTSEYNGKMKDESAIRRSHFYNNKYVREIKFTHLCVGARVAIDTVNFIPELGLYNGSIGTVIDIVYNNKEGPNSRKGSHLPEYVIVDFPSFKIDNAPGLKPWDANNPTHVPIPMKTQPCQYNCCRVTFCPLVPAWASTIHKFQGMQAGQDDDDVINFLIIDCGDINTEQNNPGTCYVSASRAKTIGNNFDDIHPRDSSLYWIGVGMYQERLKNGAMKWDDKKKGQKISCKKIQDRDEWVTYLNKKAEETEQIYTCEKLGTIANTTFKVAYSDRYNTDRVDTSIMNMIHSPNEEWKKVKKDPKYTVPRSFYD